MAAFGGHDSCPNCGAQMAADQRYCLNCGHRRGDPRLPFMDAVVFMESMSSPGGATGAPPPPPSQEPKSSRMNGNAALIAGVATLVLAIGVGFLIGRSGHENGSGGAQAAAPIKVIEVGGGGGGGKESTEPAVEETTGADKPEKGTKGKEKAKSSGKPPAKKKVSEVKEGSEEEKERAAEKTAEVLHSTGPQAETGAQVGDTCEPGTPGCEGEEFTGNFFGE